MSANTEVAVNTAMFADTVVNAKHPTHLTQKLKLYTELQPKKTYGQVVY
jgi:hypothetical protein